MEKKKCVEGCRTPPVTVNKQFNFSLKETQQDIKVLLLYSLCLPHLVSSVSELNDPKQTPADHLNVFNLFRVQSGLWHFFFLFFV